uniref:Uncharacterized protein n=1 Tax=Glossina brevipalpis TaxID=37001 RepID=A0A1A9WQR2_9MUSC
MFDNFTSQSCQRTTASHYERSLCEGALGLSIFLMKLYYFIVILITPYLLMKLITLKMLGRYGDKLSLNILKLKASSAYGHIVTVKLKEIATSYSHQLRNVISMPNLKKNIFNWATQRPSAKKDSIYRIDASTLNKMKAGADLAFITYPDAIANAIGN